MFMKVGIVAVCCSVLQCVEVSYSVLQCLAVSCRVRLQVSRDIREGGYDSLRELRWYQISIVHEPISSMREPSSTAGPTLGIRHDDLEKLEFSRTVPTSDVV